MPFMGTEKRNPSASTCGLGLVAGLLGALMFLALFYPLMRGNVYQGSDLAAYHLPTRTFYHTCLQEGLQPYWWPAQFCGYYLHAEGQVGMFHPLHWLLYRFLPLDWAFNLEFASGYLLLYAGMIALIRRWRLPWFAAIFGANLMTFSGFTLIHFVHLQAITIIGHLPWVLLALDVLLRSGIPRARCRAWLALTVLTASQLLLGYPQYALFNSMALGLYALAHLGQSRSIQRIALATLGLLVGLLIAGVQVVPTLDLLQDVQRSDASEFWRDGSLHPLNLLQLAGPYFFENRIAYGVPGLEYCLYTGTVPLLLALLIFFCSRGAGAELRLIRLFGSQAILMLVLALGEYGGLYSLLTQLPVLGSFRCAARHIVLIHFALAVLASLGITHLVQAPPGRTTVRAANRLSITSAALGAMALLAAIGVRYLGNVDMRDAITPVWPWLILGPLMLVLGSLLIRTTLRWPRVGVLLIMLFATADIAGYALPQLWHHKPQSSPLSELTEALQREFPKDPSFVPHTPEFRAHGNWRAARLAPLGLPNYLGYVGLPPAWTLDPDADSTKRTAGVRWEKRPLSAGDWTVHENALPRARLVTRAVQSNNARQAIENIDPSTTALVDQPHNLPGGSAGTVVWIRSAPGDVALQTSTETEQLLVFAERYHPGWRASVDGQRVPVLRVYGDFMGAVVPAGGHTVHFSFRPLSMRIGMGISVAGLLAAVMVYVRMRIVGERRTPESDT